MIASYFVVFFFLLLLFLILVRWSIICLKRKRIFELQNLKPIKRSSIFSLSSGFSISFIKKKNIHIYKFEYFFKNLNKNKILTQWYYNFFQLIISLMNLKILQWNEVRKIYFVIYQKFGFRFEFEVISFHHIFYYE